MSYRVLVLPERPVMPLSVVRKIQELVAAGATVIGPKPIRTPGLTGYPKSEQQLKNIADKVWGTKTASTQSQHSYGKGQIITGMTIRQVLEKGNIPADFALQSRTDNVLLDFIHRRTDDTEIYFVINKRSTKLHADCSFRVSDSQPELWNPATGEQRDLPQFKTHAGITSIPLEFEPYGAMFIIFRKTEDRSKKAGVLQRGAENFPVLIQRQEITGPWSVQFDLKWFYPTNELTGNHAKGLMVFEKLEDWNKRPEPAVKNFSGMAVYHKTFIMKSPAPGDRCFLDLGSVKETARVKLNGKDLGVVWCSPWHLEITGIAKPGENLLEIEVVNLWPNRLVGDKKLPVAERRTHKNMFVGWLNNDQLPSGLLGPVTIETVQQINNK